MNKINFLYCVYAIVSQTAQCNLICLQFLKTQNTQVPHTLPVKIWNLTMLLLEFNIIETNFTIIVKCTELT